VDDPVFDDLDAEALATAQPNPATVSFLADRTTLTDADGPILVVCTRPDEDESRPFRVVLDRGGVTAGAVAQGQEAR
jgi:hypothetical protein